MQLIVGLGNPGPAYARTRHNLGFRCLDRVAAEHGLDFGPLRDGCQAAAGVIAGSEAVLVKPLRYMNRSGEALAAWAARRGLELGPPATGEEAATPPPLAVVDDIALPLGALRLRARGSDGGHRGLESLGRVLGDGYPRLRLGVAPPDAVVPPEAWADYVLEDFSAGEWEASEELVERAAAAVAVFLEHGLDLAAGRFNRRGNAPREAGDDEDLQNDGP